jgi:hypothetical protein
MVVVAVVVVVVAAGNWSWCLHLSILVRYGETVGRCGETARSLVAIPTVI